jgi:hypothetical protein
MGGVAPDRGGTSSAPRPSSGTTAAHRRAVRVHAVRPVPRYGQGTTSPVVRRIRGGRKPDGFLVGRSVRNRANRLPGTDDAPGRMEISAGSAARS